MAEFFHFLVLSLLWLAVVSAVLIGRRQDNERR